jgi:hypothetical protein
MPTRRELTSERIAGGTSAKKNAWPFIVSWFNLYYSWNYSV